MEGTIKFELRTGVKGKHGKLPISMIYSVMGDRVRFSTGLTIHKEYWSKKNQRAVFIPVKEAKKLLLELHLNLYLTEIEVKEINNALNEVSTAIHNLEIGYRAAGVAFTSRMIIDALQLKQNPTTKKEEPKEVLFDFMDKYIVDHAPTRVKGSLTVYRSTANHLKTFQEATKTKVRFSNIDYNFFQQFQAFLIDSVKTNKDGSESPLLNNTTIVKILSTLKTFLNYAKIQGININEGYKNFPIKKDPPQEVIALTQEELDSLLLMDLSENKRLDQTRDAFCFSCATGLRYSDIKQLSRNQIKGDIINLVVTKTKTELTIPLNKISYAILDKYKESIKPLPVISNQKLNDYIKELCEIAEINEAIEITRYRGVVPEVTTYPKYKLIHVHTGRKTFCTLSLEKGMSAEEVMKISGHKDYASFKRYVNITTKRQTVVMLKAWGGLPIMKVV